MAACRPSWETQPWSTLSLACCHAEVNKTSAATIHKRLMLLSWRLQRAAALNGPASC